MEVNNCTVKPECKLYYVQTGIHITEMVCEHDTLLLKNPLYIISIFMKGKRTHNFLLYRYERGSKKAKLRETDATQRATVAFGCFGLCTSNFHTHREIQFLLDYTVFLAVNTRTMDPTPPAASAWKQTKCKCWWQHEESILIPSQTFFLKKAVCSYWFWIH